MSRRTTSSWRSSAFRTNSNPVDGSQLSSSSNWAEEVAHAAPNQLVIAYEQDTYSRHISSAKHLRPQNRRVLPAALLVDQTRSHIHVMGRLTLSALVRSRQLVVDRGVRLRITLAVGRHYWRSCEERVTRPARSLVLHSQNRRNASDLPSGP